MHPARWHVPGGAPRQSGVTTQPGTHAHWLGLDLAGDATKDDLRRALVVVDDTASRFVAGSTPLPDVAHELAFDAGGVAIAVGLAVLAAHATGAGLLAVAATAGLLAWQLLRPRD